MSYKHSSVDASRRELDLLLNQDYLNAFKRPSYFSDTSTAHVFDVTDGLSSLRCNMQTDELTRLVMNDRAENYDFRMIFIDGHQDKLFVTPRLLNAIFDAYSISPRFAGFISRQHMPGSATHYDPITSEPSSHELWFSAVLRSTSLQAEKSSLDLSAVLSEPMLVAERQALDLSRRVADWQRLSMWSKHSRITKRANVIILGCPPAIRDGFTSTFAGNNGMALHQHPMLAHAYFARRLLLHTYDFLEKFSDEMYVWEFKGRELQSTKDYTNRMQAFLALSRQIQQVATDYDILDAALEHLKREHRWFETNTFVPIGAALPPPTSTLADRKSSFQYETDFHSPLKEQFDSFLREIKLVRTYSNLYNDRSKIGVNEGFAMVNQRDAEVNLKMALESTLIARASHADSRSLRIIQILSVLFLPASLVSSVLGMGFFSTSIADDGNVEYAVSNRWWLWVAISAPLTIVCLTFLGGYNTWFKWRSRRGNGGDEEGGMDVDDEGEREGKVGKID